MSKIIIRKLCCMYVVITFMLFVSCDHTDLTGEVIISDNDVKVGDVVPLVLKVPDKLSKIYSVMWYVEPKSAGDIYEGEAVIEMISQEDLEEYFGNPDDINTDRIALFYAKEKGNCEIIVGGFYKQTNPQNITELTLEILE